MIFGGRLWFMVFTRDRLKQTKEKLVSPLTIHWKSNSKNKNDLEMDEANDRLTTLEMTVSALTSTLGELVEQLCLTNLAKASASTKQRDRSKKKEVMEVDGDDDFVEIDSDSSKAKSDKVRSGIGKSLNPICNLRINFKIEIPVFDGSVNAEKLDNWFDRLETYFSL
ncbi:hypothetical protein GIB67_039215, partial [Kingdonia uniflora]